MTDSTVTDGADAPETDKTEDKSFFGRGVLLGLVGGSLVALVLITVAGSAISLFDEVFGSPAAVEAEDEPAGEDPAEGDPLVAQGASVASSSGCVACHTPNGVDGVGPTWQGLGEVRDADELRQSILDPNATIAEGFTADLMPKTYADILSDDDLAALIAYIQSL
jgi:mono/diheme cytochrome c family protein